jgi:hypothetical protein
MLALHLSSPPAPLLLQRATKLTDVQDDTAYCWLPSNELLVVTNTSRSPDPWGIWSGYVDTIDPQTRKRKRLEGLTAEIMRHASHYMALHGPMMFSSSPDGDWLHWSCFTPADNKIGLPPTLEVTARKDGSHYHEWKTSRTYGWIDGHRLGALVFQDALHVSPGSTPVRLFVIDAAHPGKEQVLPSSAPETQARLQGIAGQPPGKQGAMIGAVSNDAGNQVEIQIMMSPAGATLTTLPSTRDTLLYPRGSWLTSQKTNPQQTRILLYVHESGIPLWVNFVRKLLPSYSYKTHPFEHLCVYRADTRAVVEVGRIYETPSHEENQQMHMDWLPDGKHIQFFYHNAVYIVSAD